MLSTDLLSEYLHAAKEAARRAAAVLDDWRRRFAVCERGRFDLVTDADLASQRVTQEFLASRLPAHGFLAEEGPARLARPGRDAPPTWIVDPLDGTTNYVHGFPFYCVSIGLQVAGELVVGVIYEPSRDELFAAARNLGAWLGDEPLTTTRTKQMEESLLTTGFPADLRGRDELHAWWRHFGLRSHGLRRTGSTALNLAYIAAGRVDGFWAFDSNPWDVAAGVVLVREAGGTVTNIDGSTFDPYTPDILATNGPLQPAMLESFRTGP
jgi:myo-inositol-1(or 4)-monophosphatase